MARQRKCDDGGIKTYRIVRELPAKLALRENGMIAKDIAGAGDKEDNTTRRAV